MAGESTTVAARGRTDADAGLRERLVACAVLGAGVAALLLVQWPGLLDPDSTANIGQLRSGWVGDHRSAVATWLWRQAYLLVGAGPGFVFVVQTVAATVGLYLVLRGALRRVWSAVAAVAIVLSPPAIGFAAVVGRDMWFLAAWTLALGLAIGATRWPRRVAVVAIAAGVVLTVLAVATRQNGVTAVLPVMVALAVAAVRLLPAEGRTGAALARAPWTSAVAVGAVATVLALGASVVATSAVRRVHEYPEVYTQVWDLGYMTLQRDERMIPELPHAMQPTQTVAEVALRWTPTSSLYMRWDREVQHGPEMFTAEAAATLSSAWREAIRAHPGLYLRGRFELWTRQLGIGYTPGYSVVRGNAENEWGYDGPALPALSRAAIDYGSFWSTAGAAKGIVHHAWVYLLVCLAGLALLAPRFPLGTRMVGLYAASGLTSQVGLFFLAPSVQWRYQLPAAYAGMVVACVGVALAWRAWAAGREQRR